MAHTSHKDPNSGTITSRGQIEVVKGNHKGMPSRTSAYLPTDERGHIQASSLAGSNHRDNVVPMAKDLNHGAYLHMENAERAAVNNGATIDSEKIAYSYGPPGSRPEAFMVNDTITFPDGSTQHVHLSFTNLQNDEMEAIEQELNAMDTSLMDEYPNPGDTLRESMSPEEYAALMEETEPYLGSIADEYAQGYEMSFDENGNSVAGDSVSEGTGEDVEDGLDDGIDDGMDDGMDM